MSVVSNKKQHIIAEYLKNPSMIDLPIWLLLYYIYLLHYIYYIGLTPLPFFLVTASFCCSWTAGLRVKKKSFKKEWWLLEWSKDPSIHLWLWVRGGVNPGKVTSSNRKQPFTLTFTPRINLVTNLPVPQMQGLCLWNEGGIPAEIPCTCRENIETPFRKSQGKCEHTLWEFPAVKHSPICCAEPQSFIWNGSDRAPLLWKWSYLNL